MHVLKDRQLKVLNYLLGNKYPVRIQHIAEMMEVSRRTIRYDLEEIGAWLEKQDILLLKVPKKGVWIADVLRAKTLLKAETTKEEVITYRILSPKERLRELLGMLFAADDRLSVGVMAEAVGVSISTCYNDLDGVENWLKNHDIQLEHVQHRGYRLKSTEEIWRKGLIAYLEEIMGNQQLMNLLVMNNQQFRGEKRLAFMQEPQYQSLFSDLDFRRMMVFVEALEKQLDMALVDSAYAGLMIHIAIAVKRLREGETIEMPLEQLIEMKQFSEYNVIAKVLNSMNFIHIVEIPEEEVGYITAHVMAAKFRSQGEVYALVGEKIPIPNPETTEIKGQLNAIMELIERNCIIQDMAALRDGLEELVNGG